MGSPGVWGAACFSFTKGRSPNKVLRRRSSPTHKTRISAPSFSRFCDRSERSTHEDRGHRHLLGETASRVRLAHFLCRSALTDTILVRMEGEGHYAWGESCPVYIPALGGAHHRHLPHRARAHGSAHHRPGDRLGPGFLDRISFIKGNSSPGPPGYRLVACWTPSGVECRCMWRSAASEIVSRSAPTSGSRIPWISLLQKIRGANRPGFPRIKLKFRPAGTWIWWLPFGPRSRTSPSTWTATPPTRWPTPTLRKLDRYHLAMIEQPLADDGMSLINMPTCRR